MASSEWQTVGKGGKARPARSTTVAPAPKLQSSPRKSTGGSALSSPVAHKPPAKAVVEPPKRVDTGAATKQLSPMGPHSAPGPSSPPPSSPPPESIWTKKAAERASAPREVTTPPKPAPKPAPPPPKPKSVSEQVQERGYPLGFKSEKEFRDATRPMAKLARDGTVFVSGSSVTGESYATGRKFGSHSDIDVGIASPTLREDSTQVQQSGPGKAFPVQGSNLDKTRGRTRERHPIGAKVFYDVPHERTVLVREHTPEGRRNDS